MMPKTNKRLKSREERAWKDVHLSEAETADLADLMESG
jgi:hypothetical protein